LWLLVGLAAAWDFSQRRIPNVLIVVGLLSGLTLQAQTGGLPGLGLSSVGIAAALAVMIVPFSLRVMGGGDVKLMMVCGAFLGWRGFVEVLLISSVLNGLLAFAVVLSGRAPPLWGLAIPRPTALPYAVPVAAATVLYTSGLVRLF